jgi:hypothetical protein
MRLHIPIVRSRSASCCSVGYNLLFMGLVVIVFLFVDLESRRKEAWLVESYPEYASYRRRVKNLVPWVYLPSKETARGNSRKTMS